ncbi:AbrB/MazE/SpoVT family DNA-binding domain-containing protein [Patulibacter sp. NPDC049589]|uniref:AbrB/MazE/SpoVT family DNA-binding domain-containing protein n=1 Tax=Patulibacter sp. NPDC049589 TaxID=3154731 RepID=UPI00341A4055
MTMRVGPKGQVVVPKPIRDRLGLHPGADVVVDEIDGEVRIRRAPTPEAFVGILGPPDGMRDWAAHKAEDREREARREQLLDPEPPA